MRIKAIHVGAAVALLPFILLAPMFGLGWELRPVMLPVLLTSAFMSLFLTMGWISTKAWRRPVKLMAMLAMLLVSVSCALSALVLVVGSLMQATTASLPLGDGCRVDADRVGGLGDYLIVVSRVCPRAGLWQRSTRLLSDEEAGVKALRSTPAAPDGAAQVAVTLSRYGKPDAETVLRLPAR
ncbi:hypothetical protein [Roseateles sp. LYH14W]|uniref:DUF4131 domain-containing protein n=1 Tax=Pelomonas parva TaxID=3299032 RepID=A0ABW7EXH4_9BURK